MADQSEPDGTADAEPPAEISILIVEDRPDDAELLIYHLERSGFTCSWRRVDTVEGVHEGLAAHPDIVICDYSLPFGNALDVLGLIRDAASVVPVIVVSGVVDERVVVDSLRMGALDYLLKDRLTRLGDAVRRVLLQNALEAEARRAQVEEQRSAHILKRLVEHAPPAIGVRAPDGRYLVTNTQFDRLRAAWPQSLEHRVNELSATSPLESEEVIGDRTYLLVQFPVCDESGQDLAEGSILHDITAQKRTERELRGAREELERRAAALDEQNARLLELDVIKTDLVASVSHELRTPLTSITGYTELLLDPGHRERDQTETRMLEIIERNSRRLLSLIDDLLILSRLDGAELTAARLDTPAAQLVEAAVAVLRPVAAGAGVQLSVDASTELAPVAVDREQLERVLINLLSNAVKFTPRGGTVSVSARQTGEEMSFVVADTGVGIQADALPHVFERFYRANSAREQEIQGTGLGLAVVQGIVGKHSGRIELESEVGVGTRVTVWIPVCPAGVTGPQPDRLAAQHLAGHAS